MTKQINSPIRLRWIATLLAVTGLFQAAPAVAKDGFDAEISLRGVAAQRAVFEGDDIDSTGIGARGEVGYQLETGNTEIRIEVNASVFDFTVEGRETRESYGAVVTVRQQLSETVSAEVRLRQAENIVTLESLGADQTSVRGRLEWEKGNDRLRFDAEYRERDYDDLARTEGQGTRFAAQYNRRIGPYHWVRFGAVTENMTSDNARRGYNRKIASIDYSLPIAKRLRLRTGIEARQWDYDGRVARGDPEGDRREDSIIAPRIGFNYGRTTGFYARARASYEFRKSNDERYGGDAPRFTATVGYRF